MKKIRRKIDLQLFAEDPTEPDNPGTQPDDTDPDEGQNTGSTSEGKTFNQGELDAIISKRLARERKAWETQLEEEKKKAAMSETERLKAEKEEAEAKANETLTKANERLISAEAKSAAASLGIKPERLTYALRLADLNGIEVDDDGNVDTGEVEKRIRRVIEDVPELKGAPGSVGGGSNPGKTNNEPQGSMNDALRKMAGYRT